jgi:hypothetical protein
VKACHRQAQKPALAGFFMVIWFSSFSSSSWKLWKNRPHASNRIFGNMSGVIRPEYLPAT